MICVGYALWAIGLGLLSTLDEKTSVARIVGYQILNGGASLSHLILRGVCIARATCADSLSSSRSWSRRDPPDEHGRRSSRRRSLRDVGRYLGAQLHALARRHRLPRHRCDDPVRRPSSTFSNALEADFASLRAGTTPCAPSSRRSGSSRASSRPSSTTRRASGARRRGKGRRSSTCRRPRRTRSSRRTSTASTRSSTSSPV